MITASAAFFWIQMTAAGAVILMFLIAGALCVSDELERRREAKRTEISK